MQYCQSRSSSGSIIFGMAAVNTIHQKFVKKRVSIPFLWGYGMLYADRSSGDVGCCIHRRHFYKFDGSGKKDQSQVALIISNARSG
jgi:hypothetical protein